MISISEIKKKQLEGLHFQQRLDLTEKIKIRNPEIIDLQAVNVEGSVVFDSGLFILDYKLNYVITLPSSRSMAAVESQKSQEVLEVFIEESQLATKADLVEDQVLLVLTDDYIDLEESVIDNILLSIPLQVLTEEEKASAELPKGNDWEVMTEEQYQAKKEEKQKENNPFAGLQDLLDE
ncbi:YceD family protein [Streptococcus catagoni]|uniref:YceD family protein n=1 Tax=Streptococcus catagoni TaxID=2654874 RepID=UPI001408BC6D|nr:YceD family protein [Streptococcus catagoni]